MNKIQSIIIPVKNKQAKILIIMGFKYLGQWFLRHYEDNIVRKKIRNRYK